MQKPSIPPKDGFCQTITKQMKRSHKFRLLFKYIIYACNTIL